MMSYETLPDGHGEIFNVDLQKDKKIMLLINGAAFVIAIVMVIVGGFFVPISAFFDTEGGIFMLAVRFFAVAVLSIAYIVLHEAVHAVVMKLCGTKKVKFGFTGLYAFAGSSDYYPKLPYIAIALAPVVLWGIVLGVICLIVPREWFWVVYILQVSNISGAVGDYYVTLKFMKMPGDILVKDCGTQMTVYSADYK